MEFHFFRIEFLYHLLKRVSFFHQITLAHLLKIILLRMYGSIFFFFLACLRHVEVPGPGMKRVPQHDLSRCSDDAGSLACEATSNTVGLFLVYCFIVFVN